MRLAVLPARGGSKRIPRKNLRSFLGEPILARPIRTAQQSGCFDRIIVSTDDDEIAAVARRCGAGVPFRRPVELADDTTGTVAVIQQAIRAMSDLGAPPDTVCCIYPTAVFTVARDLQKGLALLESRECKYVLSATPYGHPIQRAFFLDDRGQLRLSSPGYSQSRTQDLEPGFHDAGQWYWGRAETWLSGDALLSADSVACTLESPHCVDIDSEADWVLAEALHRELSPP